jgi:hypothetical protein
MSARSWLNAAAMASLALAMAAAVAGCSTTPPPPKPYGVEAELSMPANRHGVWAVAPTINLSGQRPVDPLLESDLVYSQLQSVRGLTVIPVNRVVEVYLALRIDKVQSQDQASLVCDLLGCDGLIVPTVTAFDPYDPPKLGASLQLFIKPGAYARPVAFDAHDLTRQAAAGPGEAIAAASGLVQAVGMYDAANGSTRQAAIDFAEGRYDPAGPYGAREYIVSMDGFSGFVFHDLVKQLLAAPQLAGT